MTSMRRRVSYNVCTGASKVRMLADENIWAVGGVDRGVPLGGGPSAVAAIIVGIGRLANVGISIHVRRR